MKTITPFALSMCLWLAPVQAAGVYKWIDDQGITHYADRPSMDYPGARLDRLPHLNAHQPPPEVPRRKTAAKNKRPVSKGRFSRRTAKADCNRYRAAIAEIEATLRMGYTEPAGSKLRLRKRKWTDRLQKECY